jgi:RNA polymerase sigma-70 factor, ECF subfamily
MASSENAAARAAAGASDVAGDGALLARIEAGDEVAFCALYRRHERSAHALALRICREQALAEDAVQEAFLAIWRRAELYDEQRGEPRSWVAAIVRNAAIDAARRRRSGPKLTGGGEADLLELADERGSESERSLEDREGELRTALQSLPGEQSSVIELAYFGGYSLVEIADISLTPLGTVKSRMRLGIEKLRELIATPIPTT